MVEVLRCPRSPIIALVAPPVAILCGGRGSRLHEQTGIIPKPLVQVGGRPILWHVINIHLAQGFRDVLLLTGYRAELIDAFAREVAWPADACVRTLETGEATPSGGRLHRARELLCAGRFCCAYADGVADIDLAALLAEHDRGGATATMTLVRPQLPFGVADLREDGSIAGFVEKPRSEHWVNGGFFCFEPEVFEVLDERSTLEREPLSRLARAGRLRGFRHDGFWDCLDTYKDVLSLNELWADGEAPWRLWE
jgi:glucose-1-phosphate cytidylyltransferase